MVCCVRFICCFWFWSPINFFQIIWSSQKRLQDQRRWKFSIRWYVSIKAFSFNKLPQNDLLLLHDPSFYWPYLFDALTTDAKVKEYKEPWVSLLSETKYAVLFIYCIYLFPRCVCVCVCNCKCNLFMVVSSWNIGCWMLLQDLYSEYPSVLPLRKPYSGNPGNFQESSLI
jgi:hypothetical protein